MTEPPNYGPPAEPSPDPAGWPGQPQQWPQQPPQPGQWQQQGGWQQPGYPPPDPQGGQWAQQPYPQQPAPGDAWGQPQQQWGQQPPPPGGWGAPPPAQPPKRRGKLIGATAAVIVLAGGGIGTYVAVSDSGSSTSGAGSPRAAVSSLVDDLNHSDLLGALDDLAPGERDALAQPVRASIDQLKRLKVLSSDANANNVSGFTFKATDLSFADKTVKINDHVQIVNLTGGKLKVSSNAAKVPFSREFLKVAFPHGLPASSQQTEQVDIGQAIREQRDGRPIRIATQKVDGKWYPSIFYTIADKAAHNAVPSPSDAIPAEGADSAQAAVKGVVNALLTGDFHRAIELTSPEELGALHDYGSLMLGSVGRSGVPHAPVTIQTLDLTTTKISGGVRVGLSKLQLHSASGETFSLAIKGQCADITTGGQSRHICAQQLVSQLVGFVQQFSDNVDVPPSTQQALARMLTGLTKIGIDTTEVDGAWYVNPVRTLLDVSNSVLGALQPDDLINLVTFFSQLDR